MPMQNTVLMTQVELGQRIRQARERIGMTQEALAKAVGRDPKAIIEYEKGKRKLSAIDLPLYAQALDVEISYFFYGELPTHLLDESLLQVFHTLHNDADKQTAIQAVKLISEAVNRHMTDH